MKKPAEVEVEVDIRPDELFIDTVNGLITVEASWLFDSNKVLDELSMYHDGLTFTLIGLVYLGLKGTPCAKAQYIYSFSNLKVSKKIDRKSYKEGGKR